MLRLAATATSVLALLAGGAAAKSFNRIASFPVASNAPAGAEAEETSSEIISA